MSEPGHNFARIRFKLTSRTLFAVAAAAIFCGIASAAVVTAPKGKGHRTFFACLTTVGGKLYKVNTNGPPKCLGRDLAISWSQSGSTGPRGKNGTAVRTGNGPPSRALGNDGDLYLDTATDTLFGPKAHGQWPAQSSSLIGARGESGANGATGSTVLSGATSPTPAIGNNGDFYLNTSLTTLYGPKTGGSWPATGTSLLGPAGATGAGGAGASAVTEHAGLNCVSGGLRVTDGAGAVSYVCNGAPGPPGASVTSASEPAGPNCATGGIKVTDGSGTVSYICNGALGADATPSETYAWMIQATQAWVAGVETCWVETGTLVGCSSGSNGVPATAFNLLGGGIASITAVNGVITLSPGAAPGILATDTYILTPTVIATYPRIAQNIDWTGSGGAVTDSLAPARYIHPLGTIPNPAADAFAWMIQTTQAWVAGVETCWVETGTLVGCSSGSNGVPATAFNLLGGEIANITAVNGVITLNPGAARGILATDTYILTPTVTATYPRIAQNIDWTSSGGAVTDSLAPARYIHPLGTIPNPAAAAFAWIAQATQTYETAVENCYVTTMSLANCSGGQHGVPADYVGTGGVVASITTDHGVVTLTPSATGQISSSDDYVRTPTEHPPSSGPYLPQDITWASSGGACAAGLVVC